MNEEIDTYINLKYGEVSLDEKFIHSLPADLCREILRYLYPGEPISIHDNFIKGQLVSRLQWESIGLHPDPLNKSDRENLIENRIVNITKVIKHYVENIVV